MCHPPGSRPPPPPVSGGAGRGRQVLLDAEDGNRFAAFVSDADRPRGGVVILPDVRGLHAFYQELAVRFAETGVSACAIDYFGRTAGASMRGDDFDFMPHVQQTRPEMVALDVAAGISQWRDSRPVFTAGFCFGGRASFNMAAKGMGLAGVIGFYGRPTRRDDADADAPIDKAGSFECPVLGLFGGADAGIPEDSVGSFRQALRAHGVENELVVYPGAPHSFFDRAFVEHAEACGDAWERVLQFIERHC